jgi:hypothetical protein
MNKSLWIESSFAVQIPQVFLALWQSLAFGWRNSGGCWLYVCYRRVVSFLADAIQLFVDCPFVFCN